MSGPDEEAPFRQRGWPGIRARLFHSYFLLSRPMTLGVRALVHDRDAHAVLLIRHTYVPGWHLPGGGVEVGETMVESLRRELDEEGNIELFGPADLRSMHYNTGSSRRDHVALYVVTEYRQREPKKRDREIAEARFFPVGELPADTTPATRRRIAEVFGEAAVSAYW